MTTLKLSPLILKKKVDQITLYSNPFMQRKKNLNSLCKLFLFICLTNSLNISIIQQKC